MNDFELRKIILKVKKGKHRAFEKLIDEYEKKVYGFILSIVKEPYEAQDLTQETFIRLYKNIHKYDDDKSFSTWLLTIARNLAYDTLRKKKRVELVDVTDIHIETPESIYLKSELKDNVDFYVQELPEHLRALIILKYFDELSYEEISLKLDIDKKKVKWQLYEARKRLHKLMSDEEVILWNVK